MSGSSALLPLKGYIRCLGIAFREILLRRVVTPPSRRHLEYRQITSLILSSKSREAMSEKEGGGGLLFA